MLQGANQAAERERSGHSIHTAPNSRPPVTPPIELALGALELHGKRRTLLSLFSRRVTRGAIIHWRKGRRATPAWALETLATALSAKIDSLQHVRALLAAELEKRKALVR